VLRLLLLALSLCGASAFAQAPDWRSVAPPLPLSAPVTPITAPVAIGGAAWGGWRKLCREQWERLDRAPRRDCLTVASIARDAPARATRLILAPEALRGERLAVLRRDDGAITSFTHEPPDAARDGALVPWRRHFESWSLTAQRISAGVTPRAASLAARKGFHGLLRGRCWSRFAQWNWPAGLAIRGRKRG